MILIDMEMPTVCEDCHFYDTNYDYPTCLVNNHSRGYNFNGFEYRMNDCPLREVVVCKDCNNYYKDSLNKWCFKGKYSTKENRFCSYGDRRTE